MGVSGRVSVSGWYWVSNHVSLGLLTLETLFFREAVLSSPLGRSFTRVFFCFFVFAGPPPFGPRGNPQIEGDAVCGQSDNNAGRLGI